MMANITVGAQVVIGPFVLFTEIAGKKYPV